jgi:hypothetical protein
MYQKFWKQFLAEQSDATYKFEPDSRELARDVPAPPALPTMVPDEPIRPDPREVIRSSSSLSGFKAFLKSKGLQYRKNLGSGQDGFVVRAFNVETGQMLAVKFINAARTSMETARREVRNYEFVKRNRESLGEDAKYLPVVYDAEMAGVPAMGETMDGRLVVHGVIYMEELEPLPSEVARNLFAVGGTTPVTMAAKDKRDRRLFKNPKLVSSLLNVAWSLTDPATTSGFMSMEAQFAAEKRIIRDFFKDEYDLEQIEQDPYVRHSRFGKQAKILASLYIRITYEEMLKNPEDETDLPIVRDYESTIKEDLLDSFTKAYIKPLVTGAAGRQLRHASGLRGFDDFYGMEKDFEEAFPETAGVRAAMKKFAGRDFKPFDVHANNVMMRPKTNDIVIVDLGRFNI